MKYLFVLVLIGLLQNVEAQNNSEYKIISSNLGSSGSSATIQTEKGTYKVSQSIGQASVIGTHQSNGYYLRQGYQQPLGKVKINRDFNYELVAKVFPNPFKNSINISFSSPIQKNISVLLFDINARLIRSQNFSPAQQIQLQLNDMAMGTYFLRVSSGKKRFNTKVIKI